MMCLSKYFIFVIHVIATTKTQVNSNITKTYTQDQVKDVHFEYFATNSKLGLFQDKIFELSYRADTMPPTGGRT